MEAQLMSHDSAMPATELFIHYICCAVALSLMQHGLTFLKGTKTDSWWCQSEAMPFSGPDAHRVTEWKKDPATERVMLIATTVDEQAKAGRKLSHPTSSSSRPPKSMAHQSPLDATPAPKSRESYHRPAGPYQPRNDPYKGSGNKSQNRQSYKQHYSGYCVKGKQQPKDQSNSCQSQNRSEASSRQDKGRKTSQ